MSNLLSKESPAGLRDALGRTGEIGFYIQAMSASSEDINQLIAKARESATEENFEACAESFSEAFKQRPNDPLILRELAAVMIDLGQVDAGLALLSDSVDLDKPDVAVLTQIAALLRGQDRVDEAADFLLCALSHDPSNEELFNDTLALLSQLGRESELVGDQPVSE